MLFSSMIFLWGFLPAVLLLYFILPRCLRNLLLLAASLFFYAWGEPVYILLMFGSIVLNYCGGLAVHATQKPFWRKFWVGADAAGNLALLGFFKYAGFILNTTASLLPESLQGAFYAHLPSWVWVALPIGISFYTFQAMSYVVDVYRGDCEVQKNPFRLALYISFFPQLIAGPIVKYHDIHAQLTDRTVTLQDFAYGVRRFLFGLAKKVLIANQLALAADGIFRVDSHLVSTPMAWLGAICYMFQIYYDFSGYSDMAIGLGRMFGFRFLENFNYPYLSGSITEFWRRWHISLSTWFKEYLYFPLGGSRRGAARTLFNLAIVFLATGIWHGAAWTFVFWGIYHGAFILLERSFFKEKVLDRLPRTVSQLYCLGAVFVGWIFFRADDLHAGFRIVRALVVPRGSPFRIEAFFTPALGVLLAVALILCGPLQSLFPKLRDALFDETRTRVWEPFALTALLALCVITLVSGSYNPFIYFRF